MSEIIFNTNSNIHAAGAESCGACLSDYPQAHTCGGFAHAEHRYDCEAGFTWKYIIVSCDGCDYKATLEERAA